MNNFLNLLDICLMFIAVKLMKGSSVPFLWLNAIFDNTRIKLLQLVIFLVQVLIFRVHGFGFWIANSARDRFMSRNKCVMNLGDGRDSLK